MPPPTCEAPDAATAPLCGGLRQRDDSGQTLVIVVVLLVLLAMLGPLMARQVTGDAPLFNASTNKHAALAAAEAGIQWYRDNLDSNSAYYNYTAANNPLNDPVLSGFCGAGLPHTCDLANTNPPEAFTYVPNSANLIGQPGNEVGYVVLTVTGRAGAPGSYAYVYAQATFSPQSVFDDAYYSNYEVLDPSSLTIQAIQVSVQPLNAVGQPVGTATTPFETQYPITYTPTSGGTPVTQSVWQAACQYETYSPNTFIDSLGLTIGGTRYSALYPYYGPYQDSSSFSFYVGSGNTVQTLPNNATQVTVPATGSYPCEVPYEFVGGETFNGPVYTTDQPHVCDTGGAPDFTGSPMSLTSGAPSTIPYLPLTPSPRDVPGSVLVTAQNSYSTTAPIYDNGPYPSSLIGDYVPAGYTVDNVNCNGHSDIPTLAHSVPNAAGETLAELDGTQSLPSLNTSLQKYGSANPPIGTVGTGCLYSGPTMIELVTSGTGPTYMDVWSPLSTPALGTTSACSNGSNFATSPFIQGIPLPSDGVVYVQSCTGCSWPTGFSDGSTPCPNPYQSAQADATTAFCLEGDAYIEGELKGQLTVASAANIIITRNITYQCVDGSGGALVTNPSAVTEQGCTTESTPDILGLSAQGDVVVAHNQNGSNCPYDGTGTPNNTGTRINGTSYPNDPYDVWPTLCDVNSTGSTSGIIVDAAVLALNGSFGTQNWNEQPYSGLVNLNGTDLSEYRGPFGTVLSTGYEKDVSYDSRLAYIEPPHVIPGSIPLWVNTDYVVCPSLACPAIP